MPDQIGALPSELALRILPYLAADFYEAQACIVRYHYMNHMSSTNGRSIV